MPPARIQQCKLDEVRHRRGGRLGILRGDGLVDSLVVGDRITQQRPLTLLEYGHPQERGGDAAAE